MLSLLHILLGSTVFINCQSLFDNTIIGKPSISCERDRIVIEVITERLFNGKVFVKGDYANPQCTKTYRNGESVNNNDNDINNHDDKNVFFGTVTRSRQPYSDDQKATARQENTLNGEDGGIPSASPLSSPPTTFDEKEIAEAFLFTRSNDSSNGEWTSIGAATAKNGGAFGGTRGEELRVFEKSGGAFGRGNDENTVSTISPSISTCEPCVCDERRRRRATNSIRLEVPLNSCNSKRDRMLNPPSIVISFIAVISFHDSFITKLDKAYHIQCSYAEAEKIVSTDLDVNMTEETELNVTTDPPTCDYLITDKNGASVRNSLVGDLVKHEWTCKGGISKRLKMLVHDCFIIDGSDQQFQVIDEHGCTVDDIMLQTPIYSTDGLSAHIEAYAFKFPDRSSVDFKCSISFCSIDDKECDHQTPPVCNSNGIKRKKRSTNRMATMSLHSNSLTVFDIDSQSDSDKPIHLPPFSESLHSLNTDTDNNLISSSFCISIASFGILISASTFFATISISLIFGYIFIRSNRKMTLVS